MHSIFVSNNITELHSKWYMNISFLLKVKKERWKLKMERGKEIKWREGGNRKDGGRKEERREKGHLSIHKSTDM